MLRIQLLQGLQKIPSAFHQKLVPELQSMAQSSGLERFYFTSIPALALTLQKAAGTAEPAAAAARGTTRESLPLSLTGIRPRESGAAVPSPGHLSHPEAAIPYPSHHGALPGMQGAEEVALTPPPQKTFSSGQGKGEGTAYFLAAAQLGIRRQRQKQRTVSLPVAPPRLGTDQLPAPCPDEPLTVPGQAGLLRSLQ